MIRALVLAVLVCAALPASAQDERRGTYADETLRNALSAAASLRWRLEDDLRNGQVGENTEETVLRELDDIDDALRTTPLRADSDRLRRILRTGRAGEEEPMTRAAAERLLQEARALEERIVGVASLAHESAPPGLRPGDERDRQKGHLHRILAGREFRRKDAPRGPSLLERFFAWLMRRIVAFRGEKTAVAILVLGVLFASLLAGLGAVLAWRWRRALRRIPPRRGDPAPARVITLADPARYAGEAEASERAGLWTEALRLRFLGLLALLEREGLVPRDRSQTNGEYLRALQAHVGTPEVRARMTAVNRIFDRTWYGRGVCGREEYLAFRDEVEALHAGGHLARPREEHP